MDIRKLKVTDFPISTYDKVRYADTDRQGHVNNAIFATYFETGRVELLYKNEDILKDIQNGSFVIAKYDVNMIKEVFWPGIVEIATGIVKFGISSISLLQCLYQNNDLVATNQSVIVFVDSQTKKSRPLENQMIKKLEKYLLNME